MIRHVAAAVLFLGMSPFAARGDDYVVIESSAPALQVGSMVSGASALDLPDKTRVVLVSASGQVFALNGPFQGKPPASAGGGSSDQILKILPTLLGSSDNRQEIGAVRGTDTAWRSETVRSLADILAIDIADGGDICLYDPQHAEIIHNPANSGDVKIQSMADGTAAAVHWSSGTARQPWPAAVPLADNGTYLFDGGENTTAMATIHVLPIVSQTSDVARAAQFAQAGCREQARLLLTLVARSAQ